MTRDEFIENIDNIFQLEDFCYEEGCDACEDVRDDDSFCEWVDDSLRDWITEYGWRDLADKLVRYDDMRGEDRYIWDYYDDEYRPLNDYDFESLKRTALEWGDSNDIWQRDETADPPKEEEKPEVPEDPEDSIPTPEEDISFTEMFAYGFGFVRDIREEELREEEEQAQSFAEFVMIGG